MLTLKKILLIGVLIALGGLFMAFGPPDGFEDFEGGWIDLGTVTDDNPYATVLIFTDDSKEQVLPTAPRSPDIPPELMEIHERQLAALDGALAAALPCTLGALGPWKSVNQIGGAAEMVCTGNDIAKTKATVKVQRHRFLGYWTTIASASSGWQNGNYAYVEDWGSCAAGTHTYRVVAVGSAKDIYGDTMNLVRYSGSYRTTC